MKPIAALFLLSAIACADPATERLDEPAYDDTAGGNTAVEERTRRSPQRGREIEVDASAFQNLDDWLVRAPGVFVRGAGPNAVVTLRGAYPLYIIDGVPIGYSYAEANSLLSPLDIAAVEVLNGLEARPLYGIQAQNGAIVIRTRT